MNLFASELKTAIWQFILNIIASLMLSNGKCLSLGKHWRLALTKNNSRKEVANKIQNDEKKDHNKVTEVPDGLKVMKR